MSSQDIGGQLQSENPQGGRVFYTNEIGQRFITMLDETKEQQSALRADLDVYKVETTDRLDALQTSIQQLTDMLRSSILRERPTIVNPNQPTSQTAPAEIDLMANSDNLNAEDNDSRESNG
jgi:hypothetical protein